MRRQRAQAKQFSRGAELSHKTLAHIPADATLRMLQDYILVEPLDGVLSSIIEVIHECKPVKGIVKAVGPGIYPKKYDHHEKHKRTKTWDSKRFRPTEVKAGDTVELGGLDIGGYAFQTVYWGDKLHLIATERDVAAVHERAPIPARVAKG